MKKPPREGRKGVREMLILSTEAELKPEVKETLRAEVKARTGEDCLVLDMGLKLSEIKLKKEQPL